MRSGSRIRLASGLAVVGTAVAVYALSVLGAFGVVGASAQSDSVAAGAYGYAYQYQYGCPVKVRWHYSPDGVQKGGWSATKSANCQTGFVSIGPQAMDGDLKLSPGSTLKVGYSFSLPGNKMARNVVVTDPQVVFQLRCEDKGTQASPSTWTVKMPTQTYVVTGDKWTPSGDQKNQLTYQGSAVVPPACGAGRVRLDKGGTFTATIQTF
jgi:hypothetical protein